jgi:transitional endoplasmic reticulum ATPase
MDSSGNKLAPHLQRFLDTARWTLGGNAPAGGAKEIPRGLVLSGPSGVGKTRLACRVAEECGAHILERRGMQLLEKFAYEGVEPLVSAFAEARRQAPCLLLINEVEVLAPIDVFERSLRQAPLAARLLVEIDALQAADRVLVTVATESPTGISNELRRIGRLSREIVVPLPDRTVRAELLAEYCSGSERDSELDLESVARVTSGFTGGDLAGLSMEASMLAARRAPAKPILRTEDFMTALLVVEKSAGDQIVLEIPTTRWSQVGGLGSVKKRLRELVEWPLRYPQLYAKAGIAPIRGVLLAGPRGSGKTTLARALAREAGASLLVLAGRVFRSLHSEPLKVLHEAFRRARHAAPCILFMDDLDLLLDADITRSLMAEMSDAARLRGVSVLASSSRAEGLDQSLFTSRVLEEVIDVPLPDETERREILDLKAQGYDPEPKVDLPWVAAHTTGFTGADLVNLLDRASRRALHRAIETGRPQQMAIQQDDCVTALDEVRLHMRKHFN